MSCEEASFKEAGLKFHFIVKNGISDISEHMGAAYEHLKEYVESENIQFLKAIDCLQLNKDVLTKKHIFVLNEFSGEVFDYLKTSNCFIVGPKCLVTCLLETQSIPLGKSPVFITPMRNLFITASGFSVAQKNTIKNLVSWMGGYYFADLNMQCTHLVSNTVTSDKYEKAGLNGISIMSINWLHDVWERNLTETISGTSADFDKHKLPVFHGLNITSSGLKEDKKREMIKLITENGGQYVRAFKSKVIDILIVEKEHADSEKFNAAVKFKKECLLPDWLTDSVSKGFALPTKHYKVNKIKVSTPTKLSGTSVSNFNPDCTDLSSISHMDLPPSNKTINETLTGEPFAARKSQRTYKDILEELKLEDVKKAGNFLDGCCVTSAGFTGTEKEKLNKILNIGGAIRYDELNEKVTHIIVGQLSAAEYKKLKDYNIPASLLTFDWIVKSISLEQPADETEFIYQPPTIQAQQPEAPSPSSKKTIQTMNHSFRKPAVPRKRLQFGNNLSSTAENEEATLLEGYKTPQIQSEFNYIPARTSSQDSSAGSTRTSEYYFLDGLTVYVHDMCTNVDYIQDDCQACGGVVVNDQYRDVVDYVLVSSTEPTDLKFLSIKYKNLVNDLWIEDAMQENKLIEKKYYHDYIPTTVNSKPLEGMLLVFSLYSANERLYIAALGQTMGAKVEDVYARKDCSLLICHSPEGAKYNAAVKWGHPVVTSDWLVECAKRGSKIDLEPYLVGETRADAFNQPKPSTSFQALKELQEAAKKIDLQSESEEIRKLEDVDSENFTLRHPRVSELTNPGRRLSTNSSASNSPNISASQVVLNISDFVKGVSTPNRELLYNVLKEVESKETPVAERLRKLAATPGTKHATPPTPKIPDFCTTPEIQKRRYEFLDRYYIPIERKNHTPSPTISDIKRRLWKEALGDQYFEDGNYNTQAVSQLDMSVVGAAHEADEENDIPSTNFRRLSDFIKNRKEKKDYEKCFEEDVENMQGKVDEHVGGTQEMVGWTDPSEFVPLKRSKLGGMQHKGTPRFSISCSDDALMDSLIKSIKILRGEVCENLVSFDETCTHIICGKPNRGEKILSGIAAGKWILELKYIEDSKAAGYFLDEEQYEFGNPSALNFAKLEANEQALAKASFRWRTKIANNCENITGAFSDFQVILNVQKRDQFQKVIKAGGGVVLNVSSPYSKCKEALKATHCFVDQKSPQLKPADHKTLSKSGVRVLSVIYLNAYLTSETEPDYTKYLLSL